MILLRRAEMIMHPFSPDLEGENVEDMEDPDGVYLFQEFVDVATEEGEGHVEYQWQYYDDEDRIEPKISYVIGFEPWGWIVGTGIYVEDINPLVMNRTLVILGLIAGTIVISIVLTKIAANKMILTPLKSLVDGAKEIGKGNLNRKVDVQSADEIGQLGLAFNNMTENVKNLIKDINDSASTLSESAAQMNKGIEEANSSMSEISSGIERVSEGASENAKALKDTNASVEEVSKAAQSIAESAQNAAEESANTNDNAHKTLETVEDVSQKMQKVDEGRTEVESIIEELSSAVAEINSFVDTISDITEQTNLLALNAAIEAARAGEEGSGFTVVADEVRKLSEESSNSAKEIERIVSNIRENTDKALTSTTEEGKEIKASVEAVADVKEKINEIVNAIERVDGQIQDIASASEEQSAASEETSSSVDSVLEVVEDTAKNADTISSGTQQQASSLEEMSASMEDVERIAKELMEKVDKFNVN
ncbi:methyl-accepting chemotaxis protein [Natranaerofaba carboxydovora]|uniref:methyl-accepting chemotaxis protein n=1 Tax=Natranaerofaba carboxydovora TaxID=2742683 RepID=UPI001F13CCA2|nr:methyl-accepting chemotaxis protein [Natranaerofaba carboxydovora]UMZ72617.1 Methyl-accepting chemotaxis protein 4 [Natranaerofaba carboxydovora]